MNEKIAIIIDSRPKDTDLIAFWGNQSVQQSLSNIKYVAVGPNGSLPAPTNKESTLDVAWSSGLASGAKVRVYVTESLSYVYNGFQKLAQELSNGSQPQIHQLSLSFVFHEYQLSGDYRASIDNFLTTIASRGVTVFAGSSDGGSRPRPNASSYDGQLSHRYAEYPASNPLVTGVGGTNLRFGPAPDYVVTEVGWSLITDNPFTTGYGSGGGASVFYPRPSWRQVSLACQRIRAIGMCLMSRWRPTAIPAAT